MDALNQIRDSFNKIDQQIIHLLDQRMTLSIEIGKIKKEQKLPIKDSSRESQLVQSLKKQSEKTHLSPSFIAAVYDVILNESCKVQESCN